MSTPDSLPVAASFVASMSEQEYVYLLFKMGGILVAFLTGLWVSVMAFIKAFSTCWNYIIVALKRDLADSFCTPRQLAEAIEKSDGRLSAAIGGVNERLSRGDERMGRIEKGVESTNESVSNLGKRIDRVLLLVAPMNPSAHVPSTALLDSDASIFPMGERHIPGGHA